MSESDIVFSLLEMRRRQGELLDAARRGHDGGGG
jgi:hypothetical protein